MLLGSRMEEILKDRMRQMFDEELEKIQKILLRKTSKEEISNH